MSKKFKILIFVGIIFISLPFFVSADTVGQRTNFFIDQNFDAQGRERILTSLENVSLKGYFYLESDWYEMLSEDEKKTASQNLEILGQEFDNTIYPKLTEIYGTPWEPGIDNNYTITILFHQMKEGVGGYFNDGDEYPRPQNPRTNEREMIYLNADYLKFALVKSYLAHEFTHLITFNQKDKERGVSEDIWLNEARADFSPTFLDYGQNFQGSNLQQRVKQFIDSPSNSLTEWQNQKADYGVVNLFIQYLVDNYGTKILSDSLKSSKKGIPSINESLAKQGFQEDFSQIFTDWTIAVSLGDCQVGKKYCYKNENLKNFRVIPSLIFLPPTQKTNVFLNYNIKDWAGNWYRIIGNEGDLKLKFDGQNSGKFKVNYVLCKDSQNCQIESLNLDQNQDGEIYFEEFGKNWSSLTLIPLSQVKTSNFSEKEPFYNFSLSISLEKKSEQQKIIEKLIVQIEELKAQINQILEKKLTEIPAGFKFKKNLFLGTTDREVVYLKKVLINQNCFLGPETLDFGPKTLEGVKCFCQKYKTEISNFAGYQVACNGFVGKGARAKLNQLISHQ